jgi:hypothetical protein
VFDTKGYHSNMNNNTSPCISSTTAGSPPCQGQGPHAKAKPPTTLQAQSDLHYHQQVQVSQRKNKMSGVVGRSLSAIGRRISNLPMPRAGGISPRSSPRGLGGSSGGGGGGGGGGGFGTGKAASPNHQPLAPLVAHERAQEARDRDEAEAELKARAARAAFEESERHWAVLHAADQLAKVMRGARTATPADASTAGGGRSSQAFQGFCEKEIRFPPTFRRVVSESVRE